MIPLAEQAATTVDLQSDGTVQCNLALSESLLAESPELSQQVYQVMQDCLPRLWQRLSGQIAGHPVMDMLQSTPHPEVSVTVVLVSNQDIRALNNRFRQKDEATDVLSFPLFEFEENDRNWTRLPAVDLGEIYISLPWAQAAVAENSAEPVKFSSGLTLYILERTVHGCLHLLGVHHNTLPAYNRVVAIQKAVIENIV